MSKSYAVVWSLHESDPDGTENYFHEHRGAFADPFAAKAEAEKLAWLTLDELRTQWRPAEVSYVSRPIEKAETDPQFQRPHRVRHRVKLDARMFPNGHPDGTTYSWNVFEVVEFDE